MLPSSFPEFKLYPAVSRFITDHLDMQFNDVRSMMMLPSHKASLTAGCNFATASTLCNLISGISVVLYTPNATNIRSGQKFKDLLLAFYPWEQVDTKQNKAKVIYDLVRNPLVHSLGVRKRGSCPLSISKDAITEAQLLEIETSNTRPTWVPLAVTGDSTKYTLSVLGLYWGVFHLTWRLAKNANQMQEAERRMA